MSGELIIGGVLTVLLLAYLLYALFNPDRF